MCMQGIEVTLSQTHTLSRNVHVTHLFVVVAVQHSHNKLLDVLELEAPILYMCKNKTNYLPDTQ